MSRWCGVVGFALDSTKPKPGIYNEQIVEKPYRGTSKDVRSRISSGDSTNDTVNYYTEISIIADDYAPAHFGDIKYVSFMGCNWKVTDVRVKSPRLILSLGGKWNGPTGSTSTAV